MVQQLPPNAPPPRLCTLQKTSPDQEYGYNLHAEKGRGQFVGLVDKGSVAEIGGLKKGDRIFAINGHSIVGEPHKKVVERIKEQPIRCEMLVATEADAKWYADNGIQINLQLPNIIRMPGETISHRGTNASDSPPPNTWYSPSAAKPADPVFVAPPPPHDDMDQPLPVICVLDKTSPADEFGFNLHAEKGRGHFIGSVDPGGIGERAGLRQGQRIVGVNGTLIYVNSPHKDVVALIKKSPLSTTLLLASEDVDQWYKTHNESFSFDKARKALEPEQQLSPHSIQISDEEEVIEHHPSPAPRQAEIHVEEAPSPPTVITAHYDEAPMAQYDLVPADSEDLMAAIFGNGAVVTESHLPESTVEEHIQEHLVEHHGHSEPALVAEVHHEEEHVPAYNPYESSRDFEDKISQYDLPRHNGTIHPSDISNGNSSPVSETSEFDIFHLTAKEAREHLRQQKKRAMDMSLEEKYRVVTNM